MTHVSDVIIDVEIEANSLLTKPMKEILSPHILLYIKTCLYFYIKNLHLEQLHWWLR